MTEHELPDDAIHHHWDRSLPPAMEIRSGDIVHGRAPDGSGRQVHPGADDSIVVQLDLARIYPLAGPIHVADAEPGDLIEVEFLDIRPSDGWGWSAVMPGLGLLPDDFEDHYLRFYDLTGVRIPFADGIHLPLRPFFGTVGVALEAPGRHPVAPAGPGGGNIDTPSVTKGSRLHLNVGVPGALLSLGDGHAVQGYGEVCVNALECALSFTIRVTLHKNRRVPGTATYAIHTPGVDTVSERGFYEVAAIGPDLHHNAMEVVRAGIEWLGSEHGLSREDAYVLCSLSMDLAIPQIVNRKNVAVSGRIPLDIFA